MPFGGWLWGQKHSLIFQRTQNFWFCFFSMSFSYSCSFRNSHCLSLSPGFHGCCTHRHKPTQRQQDHHWHHQRCHHGHCHCSSNSNKRVKRKILRKVCSNFLNQSLKRHLSWFYLKRITIKTTYNEDLSIHKCQRMGKCSNQAYPWP